MYTEYGIVLEWIFNRFGMIFESILIEFWIDLEIFWIDLEWILNQFGLNFELILNGFWINKKSVKVWNQISLNKNITLSYVQHVQHTVFWKDVE